MFHDLDHCHYIHASWSEDSICNTTLMCVQSSFACATDRMGGKIEPMCAVASFLRRDCKPTECAAHIEKIYGRRDHTRNAIKPRLPNVLLVTFLTALVLVVVGCRARIVI